MPQLRRQALIRKRLFCDQCLPGRREEALRATQPAFRAAGPAKIASMRGAGHDPTATPEARRRRSATASQQRKAVAAWRDDGSLDGVDFRRDILPKLQRLPVRVIAEAMGASISHGSKVRSGLQYRTGGIGKVCSASTDLPKPDSFVSECHQRGTLSLHCIYAQAAHKAFTAKASELIRSAWRSAITRIAR